MKQIQKYIQLYRGLIISVGMIGVAVLGVILGIIPAVQKTIDIRDEMLLSSKAIADLRAKITLLESNNEAYYQTQLQDLTAAVPTDKSLTTLFSTVDALGSQTGVTVSDVTMQRPGTIATESAKRQLGEAKQTGTNLLPFSVTVSGSYEQIHEFLSQVVGVRRFFRVRNFDIAFADMENISVQMGMDAFYSPLLSNTVTVDTKLEALTPKEQQIIAAVQKMPIIGQILLPPPSTTILVPVGSRTDIFSN